MTEKECKDLGVIADPTCRMCQVSLKAEGGCTFCEDFKKHIRWPETEPTHFSLKHMSRKSIMLLEMNLDRLEKDMKGGYADKGYNSRHGKEATMLARGLAQILSQAIRLEKEKAEEAANMGFDGRFEVIKEWFISLPAEQKKDFFQGIAKEYNRAA